MQTIAREELADLIEHHAALLAAALRGGGTSRAALEVRPMESSATPPSVEIPEPVDMSASPGRNKSRWTKVGELEGETYTWPEGTEEYAPFEVWETMQDGQRTQLGVGRSTTRGIYYGREAGYWLVFEMVNGQKRRPIVVFNEGDNPEDLVAVIKGKGKGGRSMFAPGDDLPAGYQRLTVDVFRNRINGPQAFNRLAVVAEGGDREAMLDHGLLQLNLRP